MNRATDQPAVPETTRQEWLWALGLIGCGVALRLWVAGRSAVEHFDEGVYASNLYFGEPPFTYPMQHLYAPPLLPSLIEAGMIAGLPPNVAAILPSLLAGCATLVAVWRIGRRWFGPAAGIASLGLAALSDFHIAYSSAALTDVLLTLFVLLAVGAIARAIAWAVVDGKDEASSSVVVPTPKAAGRKRADRRTPSQPPVSAEPGKGGLWRGNTIDKWALIAGLITAAAWWTKYNGWLPLAIAMAGSAALVFLRTEARRKWQRLAVAVIVIVATAAIAWSPVPLSLESVGGYSAVAANHAGYVVGPAGWLTSASRQVANQSAMEGVLSWLSVALALVAALAVRDGIGKAEHRGCMSSRLMYALGWAVGLTIATVVESTFLVLLVLSFAGLGRWLWEQVRRGAQERVDEATVGTCLVLAWFAGLLLATPNYWPYPRLVMPLLTCLWLAGGSGLAPLIGTMSSVSSFEGQESGGAWRMGRFIAAGLLVVLPLAYASRAPLASAGGSLNLDRTGMRRAAQEIAGRIAEDLAKSGQNPVCVIFVQAEPALVFQLQGGGFPFVQPVIAPPEGPITVNGAAVPTYYVYGPHAARDKDFSTQWQAQEGNFEPLSPGGIETNSSLIVRLDSNDPRLVSEERERVWLFRRRGVPQPGNAPPTAEP